MFAKYLRTILCEFIFGTSIVVVGHYYNSAKESCEEFIDYEVDEWIYEEEMEEEDDDDEEENKTYYI